MENIIFLSAILLCSLFAMIIAAFLSYGKPPKDKKALEYLNNANFRRNIYNSNILVDTNSHLFVAKTIFRIIFPYYIYSMGLIPFWYKSYKKIKKIYENT